MVIAPAARPATAITAATAGRDADSPANASVNPVVAPTRAHLTTAEHNPVVPGDSIAEIQVG